MEEKKGKIIFIVIILILIILNILLLFFLKNDIGKINYFTPTGNVDIFHIDCDCTNCGESKPVFGDGSVLVMDENGNWKYQNKLRIFENPAFEMKNKIAPGSTNTYQFVIYNNSDSKLDYSFKMNEVNKYNINMKYRLKLNGKYIIGNNSTWVDADKLNIENHLIDSSKNDNYSLEWKWFNSSNDTKIGKTENAGYELNINISFIQAGE